MVQANLMTTGAPRPGQRNRALRALGFGLLAGAVLTLIAVGSTSAAPAGDFTTFDLGPAGSGGDAIASGPDGNMWFTNNANNSIGRITPSGATTFFAVPTPTSSTTSGPGLFSIAAGPDGNMWFTEFNTNLVGKITPAGVITTYPVPIASAHPLGITPGPDGNIWFTLDFANAIGRITPSGVITTFPIPTPGATGTTAVTASNECVMCGYLITAGPLDSLWFTIPAANLVGRITVAGVVTTLPVATATPTSTSTDNVTLGAITAGDDGNLWITKPAEGKITRLTTVGVATEFTLPTANSQPTSITPGPNASLWIGEYSGNALVQFVIPGVKSSPVITQYTIPTASSLPTSVATGNDGSVWFTNVVNPAPGSTSLQVGRLATGVGPIVTAKVAGTPSRVPN